MNNYRANYAKLFGRPISAPVRIRDRFTSSVWNFWPWIADVSLRVSHVVAEANERRLYSQTTKIADGEHAFWLLEFVKTTSRFHLKNPSSWTSLSFPFCLCWMNKNSAVKKRQLRKIPTSCKHTPSKATEQTLLRVLIFGILRIFTRSANKDYFTYLRINDNVSTTINSCSFNCARHKANIIKCHCH